jgi:hypothetical protein
MQATANLAQQNRSDIWLNSEEHYSIKLDITGREEASSGAQKVMKGLCAKPLAFDVGKVLQEFEKAEESTAHCKGTFEVDAPPEKALDIVLKGKPEAKTESG